MDTSYMSTYYFVFFMVFLFMAGISIFYAMVISARGLSPKLSAKSATIFSIVCIVGSYLMYSSYEYENNKKIYDDYKKQVTKAVNDVEKEIEEKEKKLLVHKKQDFDEKLKDAYWSSGFYHKGVYYNRKELYDIVNTECEKIANKIQNDKFYDKKFNECVLTYRKNVDTLIDTRGISQRRILKEKYGIE